MSPRTRAREIALQYLYHLDLLGEEAQDLEEFLHWRASDERAIGFARSICLGMREKMVELDGIVSHHLDNWVLDRLATVDRNILRLAAWEMLHGGTPAAVVINEAVELGKRFGGEESGGFVNGVLDGLRRAKGL